MALVLDRINNRLNSCSATTSLTHKNELFVEVFQDVKTVLSDIEQSRSGHEIIVDFLKSVANQFIYLLTFTMHPGFFSTTNQPLQSVKECVQRSIQLLQDLEEMERLSNVAASPSR